MTHIEKKDRILYNIFSLKKTTLKGVFLLILLVSNSFALDINAVFDNQKKAAFPDTAEIIMETSMSLPGIPMQRVKTTLLSAGSEKTKTTIKSQMMYMEIVKNGNNMRITDLKTGKKLPAQNLPQSGTPDLANQMGNPEDYTTPIKENDLWKIVPKENNKPTFYYSDKIKRVVKMFVNVPIDASGSEATSEANYKYCDNSCNFPGTLSSVEIKTLMPNAQESNVKIDVISVKKINHLPKSMFDLK